MSTDDRVLRGTHYDSPPHSRDTSRHVPRAIDRWALAGLARGLDGVPVRLTLWDGSTRSASREPAVATVAIRDRATLWRLLASTDLTFGEAYMNGRLDVEGDLVGFLTGVARRFERRQRQVRAVPWFRRRGSGISRATRNARHHYDLGNDFYRLWLDDQLVYTCGYFATPEVSLDQAQRDKLEYVARKLALRPGERVVEAGCGWGALALHLAREHGVHVRAWNVSREQVAWARRRALEEQLQDRVEFIEGDYRSIDATCDAFVSVGMLEHVGATHYPVLGAVMDRCLHPERGRGLLHFIGRNVPAATGAWITRYIFPGGYLPTVREAVEGALEPHGFSVLDVENLRRHYTLTLAHWLERFENAGADVSARYGERFRRMWRLYLAEAQAGFRGGSLQLFQVTFARGQNDGMPWTRSGLYAAASAALEAPAPVVQDPAAPRAQRRD
jgi:cyclopropane-fatty-acyl-phospholipid synthase